jgi:5-formyltetrahydrofolate cyclo-ligase
MRARELDLILLPLVAFDESGQRLGMGGGFFDRSLAFLAWRQHWRKPHLIGLAYDFQKVAALPREPWDVPLDAVVTDQNVYVTPAV